MTWKIRHEGSPTAITGLTSAQILEGLQDGLWEPTDEVLGPSDAAWNAIENHPQFAEAAADLEPPPSAHHEDESRIDMNPLIDVTLVLLIFFILTTSYAALQKVLDMPTTPVDQAKGPRVVSEKTINERALRLEARQEDGVTVIRVEGQEVPLTNLVQRLRELIGQTHKIELLVKADDDVSWGTFVAIQDAAKGAGVQRILKQTTRAAAGK